MDPGHVGGVQQVVGDVEVVARYFHAIALVQAPLRVAPVIDGKDAVRVRQRGVAHPDPQQTIALLQWIGAHLCAAGWLVHARRFDAGARAVKGQAVVAAFELVVMQTAHGQRQLAVRAGIFQGHHAAILAAIEHDVLVQDFLGVQAFGDFLVPGGDIPGIA